MIDREMLPSVALDDSPTFRSSDRKSGSTAGGHFFPAIAGMLAIHARITTQAADFTSLIPHVGLPSVAISWEEHMPQRRTEKRASMNRRSMKL